MKPSGPGFLFVGRFFYCSFNFIVVIDLFIIFYFLPGSSLEGCSFLRVCPFLPGCPFDWHIVTVVSCDLGISAMFLISFLILLI